MMAHQVWKEASQALAELKVERARILSSIGPNPCGAAAAALQRIADGIRGWESAAACGGAV